ncbi:MAG: 7-carboxy-7-deazaguanine synthase [Saprospiraceae bacterium]|nr:7-carboxy-7-deazaguanine synthase [Saprospiraceae bacterium]
MSKQKTYKIKEIYYTIQGEGHHTGRPAVFCRFAGCNLWSGLEKDRATAICKFCDTDFWGIDGKNGGKYGAEELANIIRSQHPPTEEKVYVVCTGGEPALQMDEELISVFHQHNLIIAIETNGTIALPKGIDWVCVSPKADTDIVVTNGDELKLVYPQVENLPSQYEHFNFIHFYLQPLDDEHQEKHINSTVEYCMKHPRWNLSLQTHKIIGIN